MENKNEASPTLQYERLSSA